jgi:hypothetical protein
MHVRSRATQFQFNLSQCHCTGCETSEFNPVLKNLTEKSNRRSSHENGAVRFLPLFGCIRTDGLVYRSGLRHENRRVFNTDANASCIQNYVLFGMADYFQLFVFIFKNKRVIVSTTREATEACRQNDFAR